ncbi:putative transcription factor C2H2 family [Lupinus albus]|uniref:Putative transcription factor C2H2 family n=1 Tax=Lupinus albus TaxID=3870 RepID=A0A6A4NZ50_LUPAL|nr:putative transcription factor C2H2 family [Lupinus albus]
MFSSQTLSSILLRLSSHYCSVCRKSSVYKCYCCPKAFCRSCLVEENDDFAIAKGKKGFCSHCLELAVMIEEKFDVTSEGVKIDFRAPGTYEYLFSEYYRRIKEKEGINYSHVHSAYILWKKATESAQAKEPPYAGSSKKGKEVATPTTTSLPKRKRSSSTSTSLARRRDSSRRNQTRSLITIPVLTSPNNADLSVDDVMHGCASIAENVENPSYNVTYPYVGLPHNFASWTSQDDAKLASSFISVHPDIVFPDSSYAQCFLEPAYKTFVVLLKMFRDSSSIHELVSENRALVVEKLKGMKLFGFSGSWLESLLDKLSGPNSLHAHVDISILNQNEESYASQRVSLMAYIDELTSILEESSNKLSEVETKLKDIAAEKRIYEEACNELGSFFNF